MSVKALTKVFDLPVGDSALNPQNPSLELLIKIKKARAERRKRITWGKSKLIKYLAEIRRLKACGASYADMQFWLRKEKRIKVSRSTIKRFLDKNPSAINWGS